MREHPAHGGRAGVIAEQEGRRRWPGLDPLHHTELPRRAAHHPAGRRDPVDMNVLLVAMPIADRDLVRPRRERGLRCRGRGAGHPIARPAVIDPVAALWLRLVTPAMPSMST